MDPQFILTALLCFSSGLLTGICVGAQVTDPLAEWRSLPLIHRPLTLADTLRPDPAYRERRLAQFSPERAHRYQNNAMLVQDKLLASQVDWMRRNMLDALRRKYRIAAERLMHG